MIGNGIVCFVWFWVSEEACLLPVGCDFFEFDFAHRVLENQKGILRVYCQGVISKENDRVQFLNPVTGILV